MGRGMGGGMGRGKGMAGGKIQDQVGALSPSIKEEIPRRRQQVEEMRKQI
jgi:hypothetical protein